MADSPGDDSLFGDGSLPGNDTLQGNNSLPGNDHPQGDDSLPCYGTTQDSEAPPSIPHHPVATFADYAALEASVRAHCEAHGYEIAVISSKKQGGEKCISCAKGVKRKLKTESKIKKRSKITGCPFTIHWSLVGDGTKSWRLAYPRGVAKGHNHGPTEASKLANLRRNSRKDTTLSEFIAVLLAAEISVKQIKVATKLQFANLAIPLTETNIRNEIYKQRRAGRTLLNPSQ